MGPLNLKRKYSLNPTYFRLWAGIFIFLSLLAIFTAFGFLLLAFNLSDRLLLIYLCFAVIISIILTRLFVRNIPSNLTLQSRYSPLTKDEAWGDESNADISMDKLPSETKVGLDKIIMMVIVPLAGAIGYHLFSSLQSFIAFGIITIIINSTLTLLIYGKIRVDIAEAKKYIPIGIALTIITTVVLYITSIMTVKLYLSIW